MKKRLFQMAAVLCAAAMTVGGAVPAAAVTRDGNSSYYADVTNDYYTWAVEAVDYLSDKGIAHGMGQNMFEPAENIKRCDFIVLLNYAFKLPEINKVAYGFADVPEDEYYYTAVINAKGNGIVTNVANFYPEEDLTRLDAFLMMYRALQNMGYVKGYGSTDTSMYADEYELVNTESKIALGTLTNMDIVHGSDGYILPYNTMSRAEMAVLIYSTLKFMEEEDANTALKENDKNTKPAEDEGNEGNADTPSKEVGEYDSQTFNKPVTIEKDQEIDGMNIRASLSKEKMNLDSKDGSQSAEYVNAPALTVKGGAKVNASNSSVVAYALPSALKVMGGSALNLDNSTIAGIETTGVDISENNTFSMTAGSLSVKGADAFAVTAAGGNVSLADTSVVSEKNTAVRLMKNTDFKAENTSIKAESKNTGAINIFAPYYDSKNGVINIDLKNVQIINSTGSAFYLNNNDAVINLNGDCTFDSKYLLYTTNASTKSASTESKVTINLNDQDAKGELYIDTTTRLQLNVNDGSCYEGAINTTQASDRCSLYLAKDGKIILTDDCYLDEFVTEGDDLTFTNIIDNGHVIYYDKEADANSYLDSDTYSLQYGGELKPRWE